MTARAATSQRLTVAEAAAALGVSRMTVRRMIQRGQLEAERVHRPQGTAFVVAPPVDGTDQDTPTARPARHMGRPNGTGQGAVPELMAAWSETFLGPIMARVAEQEATIRGQAEMIGELRAENRALTASTAPQSTEPTTDAFAARLRPLAPWLVAVLAIVAVVGLLAWRW
jgi:excisionase family DNA binding protein